MTLLRTNMQDLYLEDALPFVEKVIQEEYESYKPVHEMLFNVADMKHGIVQHTQVSSLSPASKVQEGEEIPQDQIRQGYATTYKAEKYGILLATTIEAIKDERTDVISKNPRRLARAFNSAEQISAAAVLNAAFTTTGGDGKSLCATDHPLLSPGAGTGSNRLATDADLSLTSLKDMQTLFKKQVDSSGNKLMIQSRKLIVPSELEYLAYELVKSIMQPGDSKNDVNVMGPQGLYKLDPVCWEYLTDTDAWFLASDPTDHEMYFFWAERPSLASSEEFKSQVALTRMTGRWVCGFSDWRGICGTTGA